MENIKVICVDDSHRPAEIPERMWIQINKEYTVIGVDKMLTQNKIIGFKLAEVELIGCEPYLYYSAHRFIPVNELEVMEDSKLEHETA